MDTTDPWAEAPISSPSPIPPPPLSEDDGFDSFDEAPSDSAPFVDAQGFGDDDDFGDFGDFGDGQGEIQASFDSIGLEEEEEQPESGPPATPMPSFNLSPFPDLQTLRFSLEQIIHPIYPFLDPAVCMSSEEVREVAGLGQVLAEEKTRAVYQSLVNPPPLKPLDWTRSRVRREHLISLGVPVNLDEVAMAKHTSLPPLMIKTNAQQPSRPMSTPPIERTPSFPKRANTIGHQPSSLGVGSRSRGVRSGGSSPSRAAGPGSDVDLGERGRKAKTFGLGERPGIDWGKLEELTDLDGDSLSLLSLVTLSELQTEMATQSSQASALLSYLLQLRDAQQNDALVSNGLIAELVMNAQKASMAGRTGSSSPMGGGGGWRRSVVGGGGRGC